MLLYYRSVPLTEAQTNKYWKLHNSSAQQYSLCKRCKRPLVFTRVVVN